MNVAQELGDDELYDYDILVKLLGDHFDPASRVSASRFHGQVRCHHEDADSFADAITELCHLGYPQSSPELRQELISEQFVRGQSDPELKKYLWVVIRTQKDRKLQALIEVCADFASLSTTGNIHRLAEQTPSASAAVRWDTRKLAAQSQMRRYHLNRRVGTCKPTLSNKETIIHHWETPFRPGPHPYRSECNSSGHQFILID